MLLDAGSMAAATRTGDQGEPVPFFGLHTSTLHEMKRSRDVPSATDHDLDCGSLLRVFRVLEENKHVLGTATVEKVHRALEYWSSLRRRPARKKRALQENCDEDDEADSLDAVDPPRHMASTAAHRSLRQGSLAFPHAVDNRRTIKNVVKKADGARKFGSTPAHPAQSTAAAVDMKSAFSSGASVPARDIVPGMPVPRRRIPSPQPHKPSSTPSRPNVDTPAPSSVSLTPGRELHHCQFAVANVTNNVVQQKKKLPQDIPPTYPQQQPQNGQHGQGQLHQPTQTLQSRAICTQSRSKELPEKPLCNILPLPLQTEILDATGAGVGVAAIPAEDATHHPTQRPRSGKTIPQGYHPKMYIDEPKNVAGNTFTAVAHETCAATKQLAKPSKKLNVLPHSSEMKAAAVKSDDASLGNLSHPLTGSDEVFMTRLAALTLFRKANHHPFVRKKDDAELFKWCNAVRQAGTLGELGRDRRTMMIRAGFEWRQIEVDRFCRFLRGRDEFVDEVRKFGSFGVHGSESCTFKWFQAQKKEFESGAMLTMKKSVLTHTPEFLSMLWKRERQLASLSIPEKATTCLTSTALGSNHVKPPISAAVTPERLLPFSNAKPADCRAGAVLDEETMNRTFASLLEMDEQFDGSGEAPYLIRPPPTDDDLNAAVSFLEEIDPTDQMSASELESFELDMFLS
jgi:hypothetical protein